jgi:uncharacterized protein YbjT (DUF2867 family)
MTTNNKIPTLALGGATGRVGRRVVKQLLDAKKLVRALVRDFDKARELFGKEIGNNDQKLLEIVVCDLGQWANLKTQAS